MFNNILKLVTVSLLVFSFSCKESSTESETKDEPITPPVSIQIETAISKNNFDLWAMSTKSLVESSVNPYNLFVPVVSESLPWKKSGNTWYCSQSNGASSVKYQMVDQGETYKFSYIISGSYEGKTVSDFTLYETAYSKNNKSGEWFVYDISSNGIKHIEFKYIWSFSTEGDFTGTMNSYNEAGDITEKTISFIKSDRSGTYSVFTGNTKSAFYLWNINGSGQINFFENDGITVKSTHFWPANP